MSLTFNIIIEKPVRVIELVGSITSDNDVSSLNDLLLDEHFDYIYDISQLTHTNSSGIGFFIRTLTRCRIGGGELVLVGLTGNVLKLFEISKIERLFTIYKSVEEGKTHFN
ncbi:MAG: STAS domain-containing protein [Bacteroidota bacterium]